MLILGHWPHIGPVRATLGCLWGPGGLPKGARRLPRDNPRRPKPFPWSASGLPLGAGPPEGGRGPQGDNPGDPKGASRCRGAPFLKKHPKTMSISLRRNVHAVEARSPYWSKEGAGRTRITTARRKVQTYAKTHVVENVHAVEVNKAHFEVIGSPGERQSPRYAELFVVALKGACGRHFDQPGSLA